MTYFRTISSLSLGAVLYLTKRANCMNIAAPEQQRARKAIFMAIALAIPFAIVTAPNVMATTSVSLTQNEFLLAKDLSSRHAWVATRNASHKSRHPLAIQTLSIELDERKKGSQLRRARVYQFNYESQQSRLVLVDLDKQTIVNEQNIDTIHLPLNDVEIQTARHLVEHNVELMAQLNARRAIQGKSALHDLSAVDVKASIFEPNSTIHMCAKHRCALLSLFDQTRTVFTVEPVVNLQTLSVTTLQNSF